MNIVLTYSFGFGLQDEATILHVSYGQDVQLTVDTLEDVASLVGWFVGCVVNDFEVEVGGRAHHVITDAEFHRTRRMIA